MSQFENNQVRETFQAAADLSAKMRWMQPWSQTAEEAGRTQDLVEQFEERRRASRPA